MVARTARLASAWTASWPLAVAAQESGAAPKPDPVTVARLGLAMVGLLLLGLVLLLMIALGARWVRRLARHTTKGAPVDLDDWARKPLVQSGDIASADDDDQADSDDA